MKIHNASYFPNSPLIYILEGVKVGYFSSINQLFSQKIQRLVYLVINTVALPINLMLKNCNKKRVNAQKGHSRAQFEHLKDLFKEERKSTNLYHFLLQSYSVKTQVHQNNY